MKSIDEYIKEAVESIKEDLLKEMRTRLDQIAEEVREQMLDEIEESIDETLIDVVTRKIEDKLRPLINQLKGYVTRLGSILEELEKL